MLDEIYIWLKGSISWLLPSISGTAARLSYDSEKKKISKGLLISSFIVGCFIGYIVDVFLTEKGIIGIRGAITAAAGFLSKDIVKFLMSKKDVIFDKTLSGLASVFESFRKKKDE